MPPAQLRSLWHDICRTPAPEIAPDLLRRSIAWRLQERMYGGLTPSVKKRIAKLQKKLAKSSLAGMPLKLHSSQAQGWFEHGMAKAIICWLKMRASNMMAGSLSASATLPKKSPAPTGQIPAFFD